MSYLRNATKRISVLAHRAIVSLIFGLYPLASRFWSLKLQNKNKLHFRACVHTVQWRILQHIVTVNRVKWWQ